MEPPDPSFADEFNVPQEDAILVFDVRRAAVSLTFQVHLLKWFIEADLVAFSSARFEFADEVPKDAQHRVFLRQPPPPMPTTVSKPIPRLFSLILIFCCWSDLCMWILF